VRFFQFHVKLEIISIESLLDAKNVIEPGVDNPHQRDFVDVAEEQRIDDFDCFLA